MLLKVSESCRKLQKASGNLGELLVTFGNFKNILLVLCSPVWHKLPSLGLAYISEYLKSLGYIVSVLDLNVEDVSLPDISGEYDCIGFSVFKTNQKNVLELAKKIKEKNPNIKIIFGGPQCFSWQFEKPPTEIKYADSIIAGDAIPLFNPPSLATFSGEALVHLWRDLASPRRTRFSPRRSTRLASQTKREEKDSTGVSTWSFNETPFPTFSLFKLDKYERKRALPILSSRGCVRKCRFCSERLLSKGYTVRNPEKIIKEIRYHKKNNNTKWFTFHDSLINGDLESLEKLCELLIYENILWDAQAIIRRDISEELLGKMKRSGCFNLFIGLESGSDKMLKLMGKGFTTGDAEMFFKKCKSVNLHFEVSLIVGFPGEGEDEFNETLEFIKRNREHIPKIAQVNPFIKYPGTMLEETSIKEGMKRVERVIKLVEELDIKYTSEFINNLI